MPIYVYVYENKTRNKENIQHNIGRFKFATKH